MLIGYFMLLSLYLIINAIQLNSFPSNGMRVFLLVQQELLLISMVVNYEKTKIEEETEERGTEEETEERRTQRTENQRMRNEEPWGMRDHGTEERCSCQTSFHLVMGLTIRLFLNEMEDGQEWTGGIK